jgi:hypothetical protein
MPELFEQKTDKAGRVRCRLVKEQVTQEPVPPVAVKRKIPSLLAGLGQTAGAVGVDYQIMRNARNPVVQAQAAISMLHGIDSLLKTLRG